MKPTDLSSVLDRLVRHKIKLSTMIWGLPGIGKSSIVQQTAATHKINCIEGSMEGDLPAGLRRELNALGRSQLDWRALLWRFLVQTPTDFAAFDQRFVGEGLYLETISGESVHVHACVDTSGSINQDEVTRFLSEVQAILGVYPHLHCDLYFADAKLHGPHALTANSPLPTPLGGGGTDFRPFFEYLNKHVEPHAITVAIYLTDGYGDFPAQAPSVPTLWVVTPGGKDFDQFPFGEAIRLVG